jgi:hypothetical protein
MSELVNHQIQFTKMVGQLIDYIYTTEYQITFGEAWRTPEQALLNQQRGIGIKNSLHCDRLALDLNFFKDGNLVTTPREIADWWESIGGTAGLRFGDPPHFSLAWGGRK